MPFSGKSGSLRFAFEYGMSFSSSSLVGDRKLQLRETKRAFRFISYAERGPEKFPF